MRGQRVANQKKKRLVSEMPTESGSYLIYNHERDSLSRYFCVLQNGSTAERTIPETPRHRPSRSNCRYYFSFVLWGGFVQEVVGEQKRPEFGRLADIVHSLSVSCMCGCGGPHIVGSVLDPPPSQEKPLGEPQKKEKKRKKVLQRFAFFASHVLTSLSSTVQDPSEGESRIQSKVSAQGIRDMTPLTESSILAISYRTVPPDLRIHWLALSSSQFFLSSLHQAEHKGKGRKKPPPPKRLAPSLSTLRNSYPSSISYSQNGWWWADGWVRCGPPRVFCTLSFEGL